MGPVPSGSAVEPGSFRCHCSRRAGRNRGSAAVSSISRANVFHVPQASPLKARVEVWFDHRSGRIDLLGIGERACPVGQHKKNPRCPAFCISSASRWSSPESGVRPGVDAGEAVAAPSRATRSSRLPGGSSAAGRSWTLLGALSPPVPYLARPDLQVELANVFPATAWAMASSVVGGGLTEWRLSIDIDPVASRARLQKRRSIGEECRVPRPPVPSFGCFRYRCRARGC